MLLHEHKDFDGLIATVSDSMQLDNLCYAIRHHSGGEVSTNPTIQSCWDADRLDLGRVGIIPSPKFLSVEASQLIDEAFNWSISS
jgi:uncharacterized protein